MVTPTNGNGATTGTGNGHGLTPLLDVLGVREQLEREAQAHAQSSRTSTASAADTADLDAYAESVITQISNEPFDPKANAGDGIRQREHEKDLEDRVIDEAKVAEAEHQVRERKRDAAAADKGLAQPVTNRGLRMLFVLALGLSFAPTLRDQLFMDVTDAPLGWFLSILSAAFPSAMIVWPTLTPHASGKRQWTNWLGLTAALGFGLANFVIRESNPTPNHLLAIGLTAWEMMVVTFLEAYAQTCRAAYGEWSEQETAKILAAAQLRTAEEQLELARAQLAARRQKIANFIAYVDARGILHTRLADVIAAAKATVQHEHRKQINKNFGNLIGADWRTQ